MMLGKVNRHKTKEIEEQFLYTLGESAVADSTFLNGIQFKQKQTICTRYGRDGQPRGGSDG